MNARILRMCSRSPVGNVRLVDGMGQMQPVLFGYEPGRGPTLRIEGVSGGRCCWWVLPLPGCKAQAKQLFAELERHKREGTDAPAAAAWRQRRAA